MRRAIPIVVCLVWGLWFGGLIGVFIAVTTLFHIYAEKLLAATGAAGIFHAFEKYQLILAGIGLTATVIWRMLPWGKPSAPGLKTAFFVLLALSTIAAACSKLYITPQIDEMREARTTSGPEFCAFMVRRCFYIVLRLAFCSSRACCCPPHWRLPTTLWLRKGSGVAARGKTCFLVVTA